MIALIAALDRNRAIGVDGALPWQLPDDLKRFKARTLGKPVLMGRKTAESLGRALPGRENLVLTRSGKVPFDGMTAIGSLDEALARPELIVIGGGEIYALTIAHADVLWLTEVDTTLARADAWFPAFDRAQWRETLREHHVADAKHAHAFDFVYLAREEMGTGVIKAS